jgi:sulfate transport system ATP-binding protein
MSLDLSQVTKRHGAVTALDRLDLSIATGEMVALIGPSGSGKTTALRVIAGLEPSYTGEVCIAGKDVAGIPARDRKIGFVFQNYALFRHMTVADNVAFGLRVLPRATRPARTAIKARVAELLAAVQMPDLGSRYPDQLSGGQRQRVALARALATEPSVLLLDEPFGALDPPVRQEMRRTLRTLHDRLGLTTVLVTHDRDEAFEIADRVALLASGRVQQIGTPDDLDGTPVNPFVFEFLGDSRRFPGVVRAGVFHPDWPGIPPIQTALPDGTAVALIRPDEITLRPGGDGRVRSIQQLVGISRVTIDMAGTPLEVIVRRGLLTHGVGDSCGVDLSLARVLPLAGG